MTIHELYNKADKLADLMKKQISDFEKEYGENEGAPFRLRIIYIPEEETWRFTIGTVTGTYPFLHIFPVPE